VSISQKRKNRAETPPIVSKSRPMRRQRVETAMLHGYPFRVNATNFPRRRFLHVAAGAAALPAVSRMARAQAYPARPVRIVVPIAAGGGTDILARLIGQWLSERLGQQFIIENRPGAGNNIGTEAVVHAPPDGYTLLMVGTQNAINATFYEKLNYNFIRDIAPVASIVRVPYVMVVHPSFPAKTVSEFIAYAEANPGKINMASGGNGSPPHMSGELFKTMAGINLIHVPYRGEAPALIDLLGGQVQVIFGTIPGTIEYIRSGKLRALAVTTATRSEVLPDVPAVGEFVPGYEARGWSGIGAPRSTPIEVVDKLNRDINASLADPRLKARFADLGVTVFGGSPAEFGKFIADETEKWAKVIRAAHIKAQ
jgi:tripartite-type tricarboxylate transporter receptor subunit TctC